jgi:hypothetical protein
MAARRRDAAAVTAVRGNLREFPHTVGAHWRELGAEGDRSRAQGFEGPFAWRRSVATRQVKIGEARAEVRAAARTFACCLYDISLALAACSVGFIGREDTPLAARDSCCTGLLVSPLRCAHDGLVLPRFNDKRSLAGVQLCDGGQARRPGVRVASPSRDSECCAPVIEPCMVGDAHHAIAPSTRRLPPSQRRQLRRRLPPS